MNIQWKCARDDLNPQARSDAFVAKMGTLFRLVAWESGAWSAKSDWTERDGVRWEGQGHSGHSLEAAKNAAERAAACMALLAFVARASARAAQGGRW